MGNRQSREPLVSNGTNNDLDNSKGRKPSHEKSDPQAVEWVSFTPPKGRLSWRVEDTFGYEKLAMIPDYDFMKVLDERAVKTTSYSSHTEPLVRKLTEGLDNELGKVRVLARWISHNISYDVTSYQRGVHGDNSVEAVMRKKVAVCDGFSTMFKHFCTQAGIECEVLSGLYREYPGYHFDPENPMKSRCAHAWNKVKIAGKWYLCDVTLAAGARTTENGREVFTKRWREQWFLAEPEYFLSSHLPMESSGILTKDQLVKSPINKLDQWNKTQLKWPITRGCAITAGSHQSGVIRPRSPHFSITLHSPKACALEYSSTLADLPESDRPAGTEKGTQPMMSRREYKSRALVYAVKNDIKVKVRLPGKGRFRLDISVHAPGLSETKVLEAKSHTILTDVFRYQIEYKGKKQRDDFPDGSTWGLTPAYRKAGFELLSPQSAVLTAKRGRCKIKLKLPTAGVLPNCHKLKCKMSEKDEKTLNSFVYGEKKGDIATYHIQCPEKGEYKLELYFKVEEGDVLQLGAAFLICNKSSAADDKTPYAWEYDRLCGPTESFYRQYELSTEVAGSTLLCKNGQAQLLVKTGKPDTLITAEIYRLVPHEGSPGKYQQRVSHAKTTKTDNEVTITVERDIERHTFLKVYAQRYLVAVYYLQL